MDETGFTEYNYGSLGETAREQRTIVRLDPTATDDKEVTRAVGYKSNYLGQMERGW